MFALYWYKLQMIKMVNKKKYLIALQTFPNDKSFNHKTVLVSAIDINDAINLAKHLHPYCHIGEIKEIFY